MSGGARNPGEGAEILAATADALQLEQPSAPYLDALVAVGFRGSTRFHVPGHKGGPGADPGLRHAIGDEAFALDLPQDVEGIDVGPGPTPYQRAEELAAQAYGAGRTWFLTNGATQGNHALCLALAEPRQPVVVQRNSHASLIDGLVLSGGVPTFVSPEIETELGMAHGVSPDALRAALPRRPAHERRSSSRRRTTAWPPTSPGWPRWRTPPVPSWSSTRPGARISAFIPACRPAPWRWEPTPS